ncbi:unnamed protein product [Rodentolepis nana]|uniref:Uncharacterized protein n=1 Tax=Rodentolepis nana TaxID=102285 RepID=A0A0R3TYS8_RODNA|nr:unnamed protein product [Rodentolepis nana]
MTGHRKSLSVSEQPNDVGHTADKWLPRDRTDFFRSLLALCSTHSPLHKHHVNPTPRRGALTTI